MNIQVNKSSINNLATMNTLVFMVFVLLFTTSMLVHADHLIEQATDVEQSECYICHQGIDKPPQLPLIQTHSVISYGFHLYIAVSAAFQDKYFVLPQLRAPPIFQ